MCRLFGYKGTKQNKLSYFLVDAPNSLAKQAVFDSRNVSNCQGWGVGFFQKDNAYIQKRASSAYLDFNFKFLTDFVETDTMIAHVREATVGEITDHNSHPFIYRNWIFAHNGTILGFEILRSQILKQIGKEFTFEIMGTTDSEHLFYLFLSFLSKKVDDLTDPEVDPLLVRDALRETLRYVNTLGANIGIKEPHKLNVIISNGRTMYASRFRHTLYYAFRKHAITDDVKLYKDDMNLKIRFNTSGETSNNTVNDAIIIASEKLSIEEKWLEFPEQSVMTIDQKLGTSFVSL